jgi:type II secretory pathway pseudopilin PulG
MQTPPALGQTATPKTAGLAIASLVLGILGVSCLSVLTGIPALVLGIMALNRVNRSAGTLTGKGQSIAGIVMGSASIALLPVTVGFLAGLLMPAVSNARNKATEAKAHVEIQAIKQAMQQYYTEYGTWPGQAGQGGDHRYAGQEYKQLLEVLQGNDVELNGRKCNPKKIAFLAVNESSIAKFARGTAQPGELADPWGNRYEIVADWNFDNRIASPLADGGALRGQQLAIWSHGPGRGTAPNPTYNKHIRSWP